MHTLDTSVEEKVSNFSQIQKSPNHPRGGGGVKKIVDFFHFLGHFFFIAPLTQMYLEFGQWPPHFEFKKMRCLFLRNFLKGDENSQIFNPVKGDWVSTILRDLSELEIFESFEEIRNMTKNKFKNMVNKPGLSCANLKLS